ncbi:MAG: sulfatase-like hydrolase/transferase [Eubacteriales bacterium]|nr:sulfatase-like hydrolase/transferase [Eubacteriales bacterium]
MEKSKLIGRIRMILILLLGAAFYLYCFKNFLEVNIFGTRWKFAVFTVFYFLLIACFIYRTRSDRFRFPTTRSGYKILYLLIAPAAALVIEEVIWNENVLHIAPAYLLLNYGIFLLLELIFLGVTANIRIARFLIHLCGVIYGLVNHYVLLYRGNPLLPSDILAANTAAEVAGGYTYDLSNSIIVGIYGFLICCLLLSCFPALKEKKTTYKMRIAGLAGAAILIFGMSYGTLNTQFFDQLSIHVSGWNPTESYKKYGAPVSFTSLIQDSYVRKPEGYSEDKVEELLDSYEESEEKTSGDEKKDIQPNVLVIMNESLADLSIFGEIGAENYLSRIQNTEGYVQKGYIYTSVYGGGTCNSEFEFLTGNSMSNFNTGVYPYMQYSMDGVFNMAQVFNDLGYETIAFHPYNKANWNREKVYSGFQFQQFVGMEDLDDVDRIRWCASDSYDYRQVIRMFENKTAPLFLFNVTMQNHGGYAENFEKQVPLVEAGEPLTKYREAWNYLTLVNESDKAFEELISYFSKTDEPVMIVMFGDHQPTLDTEFLKETLGEINDLGTLQKRQVTPYVIWTNYRSEEECKEKDLSLNYLSAEMLDQLGLHSEYTDYLLELEKNVPVVNSIGYQTADGSWHYHTENNEFLDTYRQIQYYQLFGR